MRKLIFLPLFFIATAASCDDTLKTMAKTLNTAAVATGEAQTIVIAAQESGVISKEASDAFVAGVTVKILTAIGLGNTALSLMVALPETARDDPLEILPPIIQAVKDGLADEQLNIITNEGTKANVQLALQGILAGLNTAQAILEVNE